MPDDAGHRCTNGDESTAGGNSCKEAETYLSVQLHVHEWCSRSHSGSSGISINSKSEENFLGISWLKSTVESFHLGLYLPLYLSWVCVSHWVMETSQLALSLTFYLAALFLCYTTQFHGLRSVWTSTYLTDDFGSASINSNYDSRLSNSIVITTLLVNSTVVLRFVQRICNWKVRLG